MCINVPHTLSGFSYASLLSVESHLREEVDDDSVNNQPFNLESENMEEHKSLILHLLSKLKLGMDLTKVHCTKFSLLW